MKAQRQSINYRRTFRSLVHRRLPATAVTTTKMAPKMILSWHYRSACMCWRSSSTPNNCMWTICRWLLTVTSRRFVIQTVTFQCQMIWKMARSVWYLVILKPYTNSIESEYFFSFFRYFFLLIYLSVWPMAYALYFFYRNMEMIDPITFNYINGLNYGTRTEMHQY